MLKCQSGLCNGNGGYNDRCRFNLRCSDVIVEDLKATKHDQIKVSMFPLLLLIVSGSIQQVVFKMLIVEGFKSTKNIIELNLVGFS